MNCKLYSRIIFLFLATPGILYCQAFGETELPLDFGFYTRLVEANKELRDDYANVAKGSPYFNDEWAQAEVIDIQDRPHNLLVKYRLLEEQMEVNTRSTTEVFVLTPHQIKSVKFDQAEFHPHAYKDRDGRSLFGYFQLLSAGEIVSFYKKLESKFSRGREIPALNKTIPPKIETIEYYYLKFADKPIRLIELKEKNVISGFSASVRKELKSHTKEQNLNLKKPDDVAQLIGYANSLNLQ